MLFVALGAVAGAAMMTAARARPERGVRAGRRNNHRPAAAAAQRHVAHM